MPIYPFYRTEVDKYFLFTIVKKTMIYLEMAGRRRDL